MKAKWMPATFNQMATKSCPSWELDKTGTHTYLKIKDIAERRQTTMQRPVGDQDWVWVIIERDKTEEQILGRTDEERKESFIPVFRSKEEGLTCLGRLEKKSDHYYQVQAMRFEEVAQAARENQFMIFFLSGEGEILDRISFKH